MLGAAGVFAVLAAIGGALALHDLTKARAELASARQTMKRLVDDPLTLRTPEGRTAAAGQVTATIGTLAIARGRVAGSAPLSLAQLVPGLRAQRSGMLRLVDDVTAAATTGRDLLVRADAVAAKVEVKDGAIPLDGIAELEGPVRDAGRTIGGLARSPAGLWGPLADARRDFDDVATASAARLTGGADALRAGRAFMGADGERRYLIAIQNNAEMRDQGMVLSYAVARFSGQKLAFEGSGSVGRLRLEQPAPTPLPPGTSEVFGFMLPTQLWQSVNATADFSFSGRAMVDMYRQSTGQALDGVITIDVPGIAAMLRVLGPVAVPGIAEPVSADNAARVLLKELYDGLPPYDDRSDRRERLGEVTQTVIGRLTSGTTNAVALGQELGGAATGGHFRLWSRFPEEQEVFERTGLGGGPAVASPDRTFHVAVQNRSGTKLDYYVKPTVRQDVQLTKAGTAIVRTTVVVENRAPRDAAPSYQLGPDGVSTRRVGDYPAWIMLWGPAGSVQAGSTPESGLLLSHHTLNVAAGEQRELTFQTIIPDAVRDGRLQLRLVPQPRLEPVPLEIRLTVDGGLVEGPRSWSGLWDRVHTLTWKMRE